MKISNLLLALAVSALVPLVPSVAHASYSIHLRNGGNFTTPLYWQDGGYVMFYVPGGLMGIEKKSVARIENISGGTAHKSSRADVQPAVPLKSAKPAKMGTSPQAAPLFPGAAAEEKRLTDELNTLRKRHRDVDTMTVGELYAFDKELTAFRDKVTQKRLGHRFADELLEIITMGEKVETRLKQRGQ
jgi:hypothetical protein